MKSIRIKLLAVTLGILLGSLLLTGGVAVYMNYSSTRSTLEQTLTEAVKLASQRVAAELAGYERLAQEMAGNPLYTDSSASRDQVLTALRQSGERHGFAEIGITDASGVSYETGDNLSGTAYFQSVKKSGEPYISDPVVNPRDGSMRIYIAAPLKKDGGFAGAFYSAVDSSFLCDIVTNIQVGQSGNAAVLDKNGNTIGYADLQLVLDAYNTQKEVANDPKLKRLAEIERRMCSGESGFAEYSYGGVEKLMAFTSIPGTNGWSIDVSAAKSEFFRDTYAAAYIIIGVALLSMILAVIFMFMLAGSISTPIQKCVERIRLLSQGDLRSPVPTVRARDETGVLASSTRELIDRLSSVVEDIAYVLGELAGGNLGVCSRRAYSGDFVPIQTATAQIIDALNHTLGEINRASDEVGVGADQVSAGAQALSQGATQQASAVEELSATIAEISGQVRDSAKNAGDASGKAALVGREIEEGSASMREMTEAMRKISENSQEIGKVIKAIEDIAFQTNILALNAAVEAARAGEAGKGFAVVADEVRNLANKSSEAAKGTTVLIEQSVQSVEDGTRIADDTARRFSAIVDGTKAVIDGISLISRASAEQAASLEQVTQGVDQISSVVQTNSATAEESAAASEELSGQAHTLRGLVGRFRLRETALPGQFAGLPE